MAGLFGRIKDAMTGAAENLRRSDEVTKWMTLISESREREKNFLSEGERCVEIYEQGKGSEDSTNDYNILYSNTETLAPAIYSALPRPLVKRRFSDKNDVATAGARVLQNALSYAISCKEPDYTPFDGLLRSARDEALVPGRGLTRFKVKRVDATTMTLCGEEVPWNRVIFGYAKVWAKLPWVAFEHFLTREELVKTFGKELGNKIPLNATSKEDGDKNKMPADSKGMKFAHIYEIWDKSDKKVKFMSEGMADLIKTVDDPLQLENFFPFPEQMCFTTSISSLVPRPLYLMYEKQAKELDKVTRRISKLTDALKARGVYDSTIGDIARVLQAGDNELVPAQNVAVLNDQGGLERAIWMMPIEKLVSVLQQLYTNREAVKQVIYEITGIADIMRGASKASETLGAQQIKAQWGGLRLKTYQDEVSRYVVDCLKLMAEIMCNSYSIQQFQEITGILLPTQQQREQAQMQLQQMQEQAQAAAQQAQMTGQQPPAQDDQATKQLQQIISTPTWEEVIAFLKSDLHRNYAIQIETNSTLAEVMAEDRQDLMEFMQSLSQLVPAVMGQVKEQILPFDVAKAIILSVCQKFRAGIDLEEQLKQMSAPPVPQQGMDPKAQAEVQLLQTELQNKKEMHEMDKQARQDELQMKKQEMGMELEYKRAELDVKHQELGFKRQKMHLDSQQAQQDAQNKSMIADANAHAAVVGAHAKAATASQPPQPAAGGQ